MHMGRKLTALWDERELSNLVNAFYLLLLLLLLSFPMCPTDSMPNWASLLYAKILQLKLRTDIKSNDQKNITNTKLFKNHSFSKMYLFICLIQRCCCKLRKFFPIKLPEYGFISEVFDIASRYYDIGRKV